MTGRLSALTGLDRAGVAHGLRLAVSAWIAFAIASLLQQDHAYWAAMPIWVVSQSSRGMLIERAVFRIVGTLFGGAVGYGIVRLGIGPVPELLLLGVWIAANATLSPLLRGTMGYGALLAGMTAAIVALPTVLQPAAASNLALGRVECTLIGVIVVTLMTSYWTPEAPREAFFEQVRALARNALAFAIAPAGDDPRAEERRILRDMAQVQASATQVTAGSVDGYRRLHDVDALIHAALSVMSAGQAHFRRKGTPAPSQDRDPHTVLIEAGETDPRVADAIARFDATEHRFDSEPAAAPARVFSLGGTYFAPHVDVRLAIENGVLVGAVTTLVALAAVLSGWALGGLVAIGVCIFSLVLVTLPAPRAIAPIMLQGVGFGVVVAIVYRIEILPHVTTLPMLFASLAPFMLVGGLARASRWTAAPALDFNMCFMLASQPMVSSSATMFTVLTQSGALFLGVLLVTGSVILIPMRPDRRAAQAARVIGRDLERLTEIGRDPDPQHAMSMIARQILRLGLHLEKAADLAPHYGGGVLAMLNLGDAIARLRRLLLDPAVPEDIKAEATAGLVALAGLIADPAGVAERVDALAGKATTPVADILRDAASAMRASRSLLEYAGAR